MRKRAGCILTGLLLTVVAVFLAAKGAEAFCVYNFIDKTIYADEVSGGANWAVRFYKEIDPGGKECCNWKNHDCNNGKKRTSTVKFDVFYQKLDPSSFETGFWNEPICTDFPIPAGGWLSVKKNSSGQYYCEKHEPD